MEEEHLVKLNDICKKRASEIGITTPVEYKVYRSDSLVYETNDHFQVTREENGKRNRIEKLQLGYKSEGSLEFTLSFDASDGIGISIETDDKDFAYLLYSDIKEYLETEVANLRSFRFKKVLQLRELIVFTMLPALGWMFYKLTQMQIEPEMLQSAIDSTDISEKLNYLIESDRNRNELQTGGYLLFPLVLVAIVLVGLGPGLDKLYPINIFCWGKAGDEYYRTKAIRDKLLWGVAIAFVISAVASFFVYLVTRS